MKSAENMTPAERLKRIRSLERKVARLEQQKDWAEREADGTRRWAEEAWKEVRRLHVVCTLHWDEKQEIRRAAGLEPEPVYEPLAKFNHETREWEPINGANITTLDRSEGSQPSAASDRSES